MTEKQVIKALTENLGFYKDLLTHLDVATVTWKPSETSWSLLEVVCHLLDEEREDFKARIQHLFNNPNTHPPAIDPQGWVTERNYVKQDYKTVLQAFFKERTKSIEWLSGLENAPWKNSFEHQHFGTMSASLFLTNWLAHDYFHFRQIFKIKYLYLQSKSLHSLEYAGGI